MNNFYLPETVFRFFSYILCATQLLYEFPHPSKKVNFLKTQDIIWTLSTLKQDK